MKWTFDESKWFQNSFIKFALFLLLIQMFYIWVLLEVYLPTT